MAQGLKDAELIGYSSMTGYSDLTAWSSSACAS